MPGAPTIGAATAGNASAGISFTAPTSNGGATITAYTATCTTGGASQTATGTASPINVTSLTNGSIYGCTVTATNSVGTSVASASVSVTPTASGGTGASTSSVDCTYSESTFEASVGLTSNASWSCSSTARILAANGLPDHPVGTFPNAGNPNTITAQSISFSTTLTPTTASASAGGPTALSYALNGVKFDPGTAGTCPTGATSSQNCSLINNSGAWSIEALGQSTFDFGVDSNNAHVQPNGAYHYHGIPIGILNNNGVSSANIKMLLIGFAPDGFPIYARYGHTIATDAASALKVVMSSYALKSTADSGRPSTALFPMGTFTQDYSYVAGSGDLDQCNGRFGATPEFPGGIYHYYATDTWPYLTRFWCGKVQ